MQTFGRSGLKINCKQLNGTTQSDRVAEGEAILASIFGEVAIAA